jgi:SSS family solute:Na+ symporter
MEWNHLGLRIILACTSCIASTGGSKGILPRRPPPATPSQAGRFPFSRFSGRHGRLVFSGWTFIGHPGLIWRDGLAYAFASFYVLTIPITGTFFSKRTWLLGKRYGFITPGDMYAYYYNNETCAGWSCHRRALLHFLLRRSADGGRRPVQRHCRRPVTFGAIFLAFIVWFYVCTGGLKASTWVGVIQFVLLVGGIIILGCLRLGPSSAAGGLLQLDQPAGSKFLEVPGSSTSAWAAAGRR